MLDILTQLGTDISVFYQFGLIIVMYILARFVFIDHLHKILDMREIKTSKLSGDADKQFEKVDKIQNEYKAKIQNANKEIKAKVEKVKNEVTKNLEGDYRSNEAKINEYIESSKKEISTEIASKRESVMKEAGVLADSLIKKITKEI